MMTLNNEIISKEGNIVVIGKPRKSYDPNWLKPENAIEDDNWERRRME